MSTGSVRSPPGGAVESTSVTCYSFPRLANGRWSWRPGRIPRGRFRPPGPPWALDVEEPHVLGVALDERPPGFHVLAHEHAEQLVRLRRVVERDLQQHPVRGVHRGLPQFAGVHLAEALEPLYAIALRLAPGRDARLDDLVPLPVGVGVTGSRPAPLPLDLVERGL